MSVWSNEHLVEVLEESEWFVRFSTWYDTFREARRKENVFFHPDNVKALSAWVVRRGTTLSFDEPVAILFREMLALISEIESDVIYGSTTRCAVCDKKADTFMVGCEHHVHICFECHETFVYVGLSAASILRARRWLAEKRTIEPSVPAKTETCCVKCGAPATCQFYPVAGKASTPNLPCPCCEAHYHEAVRRGRDRFGGALGLDWTPEYEWLKSGSLPLPDKTCMTCKRVCVQRYTTDPGCEKWSEAKPTQLDPYAVQREREQLEEFRAGMVEEHLRCSRENAAQRFADICWKNNREAALERRRRALLGLERGPDPKLLCTSDLFEPRRKG